ncbi:MAG: hypothetical protein U0132_08275 [Gemmatimonadaceae bacterium]
MSYEHSSVVAASRAADPAREPTSYATPPRPMSSPNASTHNFDALRIVMLMMNLRSL